MKSISVRDGHRASVGPFEGVMVVAKWFYSKAPDGTMQCISRTLGKFSVLERGEDGSPSAVENYSIWLCRIVKEIRPGQNNGAFILKPVHRIDPNQIRKIIPGFYDLSVRDKVAIIRPNSDPGDYWMLSKATRQIFSKKYNAVIVPIGHKHENETR